jgi:molybdopterin synthase catalytic subunit
MLIRVQNMPFDVGQELANLRQGRRDVGGVALFIGTVREMNEGRNVSTLTLEHYPGMTERALTEIAAEAMQRWPLQDCLVIHRYGTMDVGEDIVLVITLSEHRDAAFAACQFLMDWLKTKAPFWKLEQGREGDAWVDAKSSDDAAAARWGGNKT